MITPYGAERLEGRGLFWDHDDDVLAMTLNGLLL
jgi:hypothetical protein